MNEPQFSVVIPLHNKRPHIARAIESVLAQQGPGWELIVVDDASTDGSLAVVEKYAADPRLRLLHRDQPGPGGYAARNLGVEAARGRWVAFLDADDAWAEGHLAELAKLAEAFAGVGVLGTAWQDVEAGKPTRLCPYAQRWSARGRHRFDLLHYLRTSNRDERPIHTSAVAIERTLLQAAGGFPAGRCRRGGDRDTWLRVLLRTDAAWSPFVGASYFRDSVNMVTQQVAHGEHVIGQTVTATLAAKPDLPRPVRRALRQHANQALRPYVFEQALAGRLTAEVANAVDGRANPTLWLLAQAGRVCPWITVKGLAAINMIRTWSRFNLKRFTLIHACHVEQ